MSVIEKRRPRRLVQRYFSERYLLLILLSFVLSVSFTRLFLEITNYPQLGSGDLHFAHVLWGGLIWFAGSLFPLIFANHRALDISAILTGVGAGLFIDEVGKFITRSNDYFYPAAAPVVYAFFLMTLFVFSLLRKQKEISLRERLYHVLEQFEEVLESDLSRQERDQMLEGLSGSFQAENSPEMIRLATAFKQMIMDTDQQLVAHQLDVFEKLNRWWLKIRTKLFPKTRRPLWLFFIWLFFGLISIIHPLASLLAASYKFTLPGVWNELIKVDLDPALGISLVERLRLAGEAVIGALLVFSAGAGFFGARKLGATIAYFSLLTLIVFINLLVFFFDQFSAIFYVSIQFLIFFLTRQFRFILD